MLTHQGAVVKGFNVKQNYSANYNSLLSQHVNERNHLLTVQVKCEARAESNVFEFCRAEAFTRRCNSFASAKVERLFGAEKTVK